MGLTSRVAGGFVVAAACAALGGCGGDDGERAAGCSDVEDGVVATYRATDPTGGPPAGGSVDATVRIICERARARDVKANVRRSGTDRIEIRADVDRQRELDELTAPGQIAFYDWEPNVFGDPNVPLHDIEDTIKAAAKLKPRAEREDIPAPGTSEEIQERFAGHESQIREHYDRENDTVGDKYYLLDAAGELAYPGGPETVPGDARERNDANAFVTTREGVSPELKVTKVSRGVLIVKAQPLPDPSDTRATGYFLVEDDAELSGSDITAARQDFDVHTDEPIVEIEFTDEGAEQFTRVTRRVAQRGAETPARGASPEERMQRFAIALDGRLVSLATIDFTEHPDGIPGDAGAQLNGLGSLEETQRIADNLRIGPLPVRLERLR